MTTYQNILTNIQNKILIITINRPDKLNALNRLTLEEMSDAVVDYETKLKAATPFVVPQTNVTITVLNVPTDTALVRTEHHYMKPDSDNLPDDIVRISDYHFWKIDEP